MKRLAVLLLLITTLPAYALSPPYTEWRRGPASLLFSHEEVQAWNGVKTDGEARDFIDLFWARRDPTPGTPVNEFRDQFVARMNDADALYTYRGKRGALTDPGSVYILLGRPRFATPLFPQGGYQSRVEMTADGPKVTDLGASRSAIVFEYWNPASVGLSGPVHFAEDLLTHQFQLTSTNNAFGAIANAVKRSIVNPELKVAPLWARTAMGPADAVSVLMASGTPADAQLFHIAMVVASAAGVDTPAELLSPGIAKAIGDLRGFLPYSHYQMAGSTYFGARSGRPWSVAIDGPGTTTYRLVMAFTPQDGRKLNVSQFKVMRAEARNAEPLLATSFSIEQGETVSVGTSKIGSAPDALMFLVTAIPKQP